MAKSIALIFHENERMQILHKYAIWHLAQIWQQENYKIYYLFGTKKYITADLAILHVDLSVVPELYIDFAGRYPAVLNVKIRDIRKSTFSTNRVTLDEGYEGRVIVKSNLNFAGQPELRLQRTSLSLLTIRIARRLRALKSDGRIPRPPHPSRGSSGPGDILPLVSLPDHFAHPPPLGSSSDTKSIEISQRILILARMPYSYLLNVMMDRGGLNLYDTIGIVSRIPRARVGGRKSGCVSRARSRSSRGARRESVEPTWSASSAKAHAS